MFPFFSIIIPVYNVAPYLRECLDSVRAQTFADWEALCVDDGSTDGSGAILDEYATRDRRFRVIHQPNGGVSAARNAALDVTRGEWVCFLDADDKVESHWLEDIAQGAKNHPGVDWIRTSYRDWFEGREPEPFPEGSPHRRIEKTHTDIASVVWRQMASAGFIVLNVCRKDTIGDLRFDTSIWFAEDACFAADYMHRAKLLLTIPNDSYRYRMRGNSATHVLKNYQDTAMALGNILSRWKKLPGENGAFSPSVLRHMNRCRRKMSREDNRCWLAFVRDALSNRFFSLSSIPRRKTRLRWKLYLLTGSPKFLFEPFGIRWVLPYRWLEQ